MAIIGLLNYIEYLVRCLLVLITNLCPVKVIRDDHGRPFLYRYHLFAWSTDGPGLCIHRFVASDPDRGYHDHPWSKSVSFILCGNYHERILNDDKITYTTFDRNRWTFNFLNGSKYHRVMLDDNCDAWTIFMFQKRSKTWGMVNLQGQYNPMSLTIHDQDGGWWRHVMKGLGVHKHLKLDGHVIATVDIIVYMRSENVKNNNADRILLIKRGKDPHKGLFALPGGRIEQKDSDIRAAAARELLEETGLRIEPKNLRFETTIGNNVRDSRGFCITTVFSTIIDSKDAKLVRAGDDAVDYMWAFINDLPDLAFDHKEIISQLA